MTYINPHDCHILSVFQEIIRKIFRCNRFDLLVVDMSIVRGSRSHPILIQASPTSGEGFGSVEQGTPDDVSTMDCPIVISSSLLDDEADTHNPRDGDTAPTAGQKSVNAHLKSGK